jgi:hypothetical protein
MRWPPKRSRRCTACIRLCPKPTAASLCASTWPTWPAPRRWKPRSTRFSPIPRLTIHRLPRRILRAERDALRADLASRQTLTESILEGQVAAVLVDEGFGTLGQLIPPIAMRFTPLPNLLAVSPRDKIQMDVFLNIDPLPVDQIAALEAQIDAEADVSSLILPLGGIALFPAMIIETASLPDGGRCLRP